MWSPGLEHTLISCMCVNACLHGNREWELLCTLSLSKAYNHTGILAGFITYLTWKYIVLVFMHF